MALKLASRACALRALPHNPLPGRYLFGLSTENEIDGQAFSELSEDDVRRMTPKLGIVKKICRLKLVSSLGVKLLLQSAFCDLERLPLARVTISPYLI